jgi:hypothetical protein
MIPEGLHLKSILTSVIMFALFITQSSCGGPNKIAPAPPVATSTMPSLLTTPMPTKTTSPLQTPSPAPVIQATWNEEPSMLFPRSAHAVVPSETKIFALAGTDNQGRPMLDVETFDGNQWSVETTLPGRGLNAPTASIIGDWLYVVGGFTAVTNIPTDEVQVYDLQSRQWSMVSPLPNCSAGRQDPRAWRWKLCFDDRRSFGIRSSNRYMVGTGAFAARRR